MAEAFFLTADDVILLKQWIREAKSRPPNRPNRPVGVSWDEGQSAPETYVALTPHYGIPPLTEGPDTGTALGTGDIPGSAECPIYRIIPPGSSTGGMEKTGVIKRIFNLSTKAIPANVWVLTSRDKFGQWYAVGPQAGLNSDGGVCTGCGGWAGLEQTQCLKLTIISTSGKCDCIDITQGPFYLTNIPGYGWCWTASEAFDACDIIGSTGPLLSGLFEFCLGVAYLPELSVGGVSLALDCCTCDPTTAYFRGGGDLLCDDDANFVENPCDNTFLVKVEVWCCTDPNWTGPGWYCIDIGNGCGPEAIKRCVFYGEPPCLEDLGICSGPFDTDPECLDACSPGTGTGTGTTSPGTGTAGDVIVDCCPDKLLPPTLYGTFTGGNPCLNGTTWAMTLTQTTGPGTRSSIWTALKVSNICTGICDNSVALTCLVTLDGFGNVISAVWQASMATSGSGCCFNSVSLVSVTCNPFVAIFHFTLAGDECGSGSATLTITE